MLLSHVHVRSRLWFGLSRHGEIESNAFKECTQRPARLHQDCPFFTVFLTIKTSSQNISLTLLQISLKLRKHRGGYWRKKLPILEEQFPVPRNTAASKIGNGVISLLWQLRCHHNPDHNKFSSLSNTIVVAFFPDLCLWRRSLCSNLGGIDPEKLYRATLSCTSSYNLNMLITTISMRAKCDRRTMSREKETA